VLRVWAKPEIAVMPRVNFSFHFSAFESATNGIQ